MWEWVAQHRQLSRPPLPPSASRVCRTRTRTALGGCRDQRCFEPCVAAAPVRSHWCRVASVKAPTQHTKWYRQHVAAAGGGGGREPRRWPGPLAVRRDGWCVRKVFGCVPRAASQPVLCMCCCAALAEEACWTCEGATGATWRGVRAHAHDTHMKRTRAMQGHQPTLPHTQHQPLA